MLELVAIGQKVNAYSILPGMILEVDGERFECEEVGQRCDNFVQVRSDAWGWVRLSIHGRFRVLGYFNPE
jgi:hypothetical protein